MCPGEPPLPLLNFGAAWSDASERLSLRFLVCRAGWGEASRYFGRHWANKHIEGSIYDMHSQSVAVRLLGRPRLFGRTSRGMRCRRNNSSTCQSPTHPPPPPPPAPSAPEFHQADGQSSHLFTVARKLFLEALFLIQRSRPRARRTNKNTVDYLTARAQRGGLRFHCHFMVRS